MASDSVMVPGFEPAEHVGVSLYCVLFGDLAVVLATPMFIDGHEHGGRTL